MKHIIFGREDYLHGELHLSTARKLDALNLLVEEGRVYLHRQGDFPYEGGILTPWREEGHTTYGYERRGERYIMETRGPEEVARIFLQEIYSEGVEGEVLAFGLDPSYLYLEAMRILLDEYHCPWQEARERVGRQIIILEEGPEISVRDPRLLELKGELEERGEGPEFHPGDFPQKFQWAVGEVAKSYRALISQRRREIYHKDLNFPNPQGLFIGSDAREAADLWDQIHRLFDELVARPQLDLPDLIFCLERHTDPVINLDLRTRHKLKLIPREVLVDLFVTRDPFLQKFYRAMGVEVVEELNILSYARGLRRQRPLPSGGEVLFKVMAKDLEGGKLYLYEDAFTMDREVVEMFQNGEEFYCTIPTEKLPVYYNFGFFRGEEAYEVVDPYAKALSVNGRRGYRFENEDQFYQGGFVPAVENPVICELHVKDATATLDLPPEEAGTFLALSREGLTLGGRAVGFDHLKELGVDYLHLMPIHNYITVWEQAASKFDGDNYNWGYDPDHYFALENSYGTHPEDPLSALRGLHQLVATAHRHGIGIIQDVVYNHLYLGERSDLALLNPQALRRWDDGSLSDGSGTGCEVASEEPLTQKLIFDSIHHSQQLGVDGFRFDLAALTDRHTLEEIGRRTGEQNPHCLLYGEPWMAAESVLARELRLQGGDGGLYLFDDDFRNGLRGSSFDYSPGWILGDNGAQPHLEESLLGGGKHPLNLPYVSCHDDEVLADFLDHFGGSEGEKIRRMKLALAVQMLTPGPVLFHQGDEFFRRRHRNNPYNGPQEATNIHWEERVEKEQLVQYVRDLIRLRKKMDLKHRILHSEAGFMVLENTGGRYRIFLSNTPQGRDIGPWLYPQTRWAFTHEGLVDEKCYMGQIISGRAVYVITFEGEKIPPKGV
ncbi:MAG: alpha-amylase family glycosyl hydrolase [Tissierellia bacterium]|nr:alpha-amylase family glycosyl hydrolase [Tissierellia bacterium]